MGLIGDLYNLIGAYKTEKPTIGVKYDVPKDLNNRLKINSGYNDANIRLNNKINHINSIHMLDAWCLNLNKELMEESKYNKFIKLREVYIDTNKSPELCCMSWQEVLTYSRYGDGIMHLKDSMDRVRANIFIKEKSGIIYIIIGSHKGAFNNLVEQLKSRCKE